MGNPQQSSRLNGGLAAGGFTVETTRLFRLLEVPTSPGNYSRVTTIQLDLKSEKSVLGLWINFNLATQQKRLHAVATRPT